MPLSHPRRLLLLPAAALLATALVGCSSDDSSDASGGTTSSSSPTSSSSTSASASPVAGGKEVCSAYQEAATDLTAVKTHLKDHDLKAVRTSLEDASASMKDLTRAIAGLSDDLSSQLKPRAQEIADQAGILVQAQSTQQFKAGLSVIELEAQQLTTDMRAGISC